jgi:putative ABC transport system permease protein
MGAGQNVTSPKVRIWDIERGHHGKEALYGILTLDVDTLMGAGQLIHEAIGRRIAWRDSGRVIGVVEDFHYASIHHAIDPFLIKFRPRAGGWVSVRLRAGAGDNVLDTVRAAWEEVLPHVPFDYRYLDTMYDALHRAEERMGQVVGALSAIGVLVACLGLFGLVSFMAERRRKEIGIRKTLGASESSVVGMLSREFALLVVIANILGWPIAYYVGTRWLESFAYRAEISLWDFVAAGTAVMAIAMATVGLQAWRAAMVDPAVVLREE